MVNIEFKPFIMSALIVMASLTGLLLFMGDVVNSYPGTTNPSPGDLELEKFAGDLENQFGGTQDAQLATDPSILDSVVMLISSGWSGIVTLVTMPLTLISASGYALALIPGVPTWIGGLLAAIIMGVFVFFLIKIAFKV